MPGVAPSPDADNFCLEAGPRRNGPGAPKTNGVPARPVPLGQALIRGGKTPRSGRAPADCTGDRFVLVGSIGLKKSITPGKNAVNMPAPRGRHEAMDGQK